MPLGLAQRPHCGFSYSCCCGLCLLLLSVVVCRCLSLPVVVSLSVVCCLYRNCLLSVVFGNRLGSTEGF